MQVSNLQTELAEVSLATGVYLALSSEERRVLETAVNLDDLVVLLQAESNGHGLALLVV